MEAQEGGQRIELSTGAVINREFSEQDFIVIRSYSSATMPTINLCKKCAKAAKCIRRTSEVCVAEYYARWKEAGYVVPIKW